MMICRINLAVLFLLAVVGLTHSPAVAAPPDRCANPSRPIDVIVCADVELTQRQDLVTNWFERAIASVGNDRKATLTRDQNGWTDYVEGLCVGRELDRPVAEKADCLKQVFFERIVYLEAWTNKKNRGLDMGDGQPRPGENRPPLGVILR